MARIELIKFCKCFPRTQELDLETLLNPVASFGHFMGWIRSDPSLSGGQVLDIRPIPVKNATVLTLRLGETEITARVSYNAELVEEEALQMRFRRYHLFDKHTGRRIQSTLEA